MSLSLIIQAKTKIFNEAEYSMTAPMMLSVYIDLVVNFTAGGKSKNPEKNPRSMGETNYNNSTHISSIINTGLYPCR